MPTPYAHLSVLASSTTPEPNEPTKQQLTHEPTTEVKEGVEWVSFVYSHHRTLRQYCIRTDIDQVDPYILDEKFKKENCVSIYSAVHKKKILKKITQNRFIHEPIYHERRIAATDGLMKPNATSWDGN